MFRKFFKKRAGVDWEDRESLKTKRGSKLGDKECKVGGEDGADEGDDEFFEVLGPVVVKQDKRVAVEEVLESVESRERKPSVTVLVNTDKLSGKNQMDARAKTPEGGW